MSVHERADGVTWLFVPGDRPERFGKAVASGADHVVLDLEDAVAPKSKSTARAAVCEWLDANGSGWVRVNGVQTAWHADDLAAIGAIAGVQGVIVPKAESAAAIAEVGSRLSDEAGLIALVETARGVQAAAELAGCGHVDRLALGSIDLALDLGADETDEALHFARGALVVASRAAGLLGPLDGVTTTTGEAGPVFAAATRARALGFAGKLCIHPRQVAPVADAFAPSEHEVAWATQVIGAAAGSGDAGVFALADEMVDRPVVERARSILARQARRSGPAPEAEARP